MSKSSRPIFDSVGPALARRSMKRRLIRFRCLGSDLPRRRRRTACWMDVDPGYDMIELIKTTVPVQVPDLTAGVADSGLAMGGTCRVDKSSKK